MLAKHGSRPSPITPWNYNGESPWNICDARIVNPWFVIHGSRLVHQNSCLAVRCSCSRCSSPSPSTGLCSVFNVFRVAFQRVNTLFVIYINDLHQCVQCVQCVQAFLSSLSSFFKTRLFFLNWTSTWIYPAHTEHIALGPMAASFQPFQSVNTLLNTPWTHPLFAEHICKS